MNAESKSKIKEEHRDNVSQETSLQKAGNSFIMDMKDISVKEESSFDAGIDVTVGLMDVEMPPPPNQQKVDENRRLQPFQNEVEGKKRVSVENAVSFILCPDGGESDFKFGEYRDLDSFEESDSDEFISSSESEAEETGYDTRIWHKLDCAAKNLPPAPPRFPFTEDPGVKFYANTDNMTPVDFFSLFFDDELLDLICAETNRFAEQNGAPWMPVTTAEMQVFFALKMLQGIVKKPEEEMYWSRHALLETPIFAPTMPFRRYKKIREYLHFSNDGTFDPNTHPHPKLNKIYNVYVHLENKFRTLYLPERDVTIGESLMHYKEKVGWVQYLPLKHSTVGIKYFMLCESRTGYAWSFIIYVGKETKLHPDFAELPMSSQLVMTLMKPLLNKGYCLTVDNFYTSPQLVDILVQNNTDIYGPVRQNRKGMPEELKRGKLKKDEVVACQRGKVMALRWKGKKDVFFLSTVHNPSLEKVKTRREVKKRPKVVCDYNLTMGGMDRMDRHSIHSNFSRKRGKSYYKKVFFHLMDLAVWNSYLLYKTTLREPASAKNPLKYRMEIINGIIQKYHSEIPSTKSGRPSTSPNPTRFSPGHFPIEIPPTEKKSHSTRQCCVCAKKRDKHGKKVRRESRYMCEICKISLCVTPCFKDYHTK